MAHTESLLSKLNKNHLIRITLDMQNSNLIVTRHYLILRMNFLNSEKAIINLRLILTVSKSVTEIMRKRISMIQRKSWRNEQYSRGEFRLPESTEDSQLERTILKIFEKMNVEVDPKNIEDCHQLKSTGSSKRAIVKLSKRKDTDKIREVKKKVKIKLKFESMGINNPIFINDSLCTYYKKLWAKCKRLWMDKFIRGFWVSYWLIKIMVSESSTPCIITHDQDFSKDTIHY